MAQQDKGPKAPSNNHPNRNWRRAMRESSADYLARYRWPDGVMQMMTQDELRKLITDAYQAGYTNGRSSVTRNGPSS